MFGRSYFGGRFYAPRYFGQALGVAAAFVNSPRVLTVTAEDRVIAVSAEDRTLVANEGSL